MNNEELPGESGSGFRTCLGGASNPRQREADLLLAELGIGAILEEYEPTLCGTIPLGVDLPESDLDIICYVPARKRRAFHRLLKENFRAGPGLNGFRQSCYRARPPALVTNFEFRGAHLEIFGQERKIENQAAYRHMMVEHRLLELGAEEAPGEIRRLKSEGLGTEPAFHRYFALPGDDPYQTLYELYQRETGELKALLGGRSP